MRKGQVQLIAALAAGLLLIGCGDSTSPPADSAIISDGPAPDGPAPDGPSPDGPTPDGPVPDGPAPDGPVPDGPVPDGPVPDITPDGPTPDAPTMVTISGTVVAAPAGCSASGVTIREKNNTANSTTSDTNGNFSLTFAPNTEVVIEAIGSTSGSGCMNVLRPFNLPPANLPGIFFVILDEAQLDNLLAAAGGDYDPGDGVVLFEFIKASLNMGTEVATLSGLNTSDPFAWDGSDYAVQSGNNLVAGQGPAGDLRGNSLLFVDAMAPASGTFTVGPTSGGYICSTALNPVTAVPTEPNTLTHVPVVCGPP